ncbi:MAG: class I SAM-dependent methyltransferase [Deltaproteobacteria bacterium]|nr:class I SAM-dependent methyltransferase [Deltaproteobacteria bacterium]
MAHKFDPQHLERLLSADRLKDIAPKELLGSEGLKAGQVFADVGCGPGFFTLPAAELVGSGGRVYAIDAQQEMLEFLKKRNPPKCVHIVRSEEEKIPLKDGEADFALMAYVLHEVRDQIVFLNEVRRILKKDGILLVIDWKKLKEEKGPPIEERLTEGQTCGFLKKAGFLNVTTSSLNQSHYKIVAVK